MVSLRTARSSVKKLLPFLSVLAACFVVSSALAADEPFLRPNDVIALVGGEDMVAGAEYGYLEAFLQCAKPEHRLRFRCLAWEGDTVFEQPRMLNYPSVAQQLDQIGATVVVASFGQMESLDGEETLRDFTEGYEKLIGTLRGQTNRRVVLQKPRKMDSTSRAHPRAATAQKFWEATEQMAYRLKVRTAGMPDVFPWIDSRDGIHWSEFNHKVSAMEVVMSLLSPAGLQPIESLNEKQLEELRQLVVRKNRIWERYRRPQNWAFLAGDRVSQPSSRDWRDPNKRWFPEEMEQFIPIIEQREKEIWAFAAKLRVEGK
jgi:hypothetical protein